MSSKPKAIILKANGTNRDEEMAFAFQIAGAEAKIIHVNDLREERDKLNNYNILVLPGGFAYGDDIVSGKILATELTSFFKEELQKFVQRKDTATLGVCNGFQVLVRTGLLPFGKVGEMDAVLTNNDSGHFECRWIDMKIEESNCKFMEGLVGKKVSYPIAHGEGKFFTDTKTLKEIENKKLVVFRYIDNNGNPTMEYPKNPNGALNSIGGITDKTGRILGLMPHPECFIRVQQHPNWRRGKIQSPEGLLLFENIVKFIKEI